MNTKKSIKWDKLTERINTKIQNVNSDDITIRTKHESDDGKTKTIEYRTYSFKESANTQDIDMLSDISKNGSEVFAFLCRQSVKNLTRQNVKTE